MENKITVSFEVAGISGNFKAKSDLILSYEVYSDTECVLRRTEVFETQKNPHGHCCSS